MLNQRIMVSKIWESLEVGIGRTQDEAMFQRQSGKMGIGDKF